MTEEKSCLIIGGDKRQFHMAEALETNGFKVSFLGFSEKDDKKSTELKAAVKENKIIILPLPATRDEKYINSVSFSKISIDELANALTENNIVFAGMINKGTQTKLAETGAKIYDYFKREEITVLNTVPTVQGILKTVLENIDFTISSSECAVFGYGRIGKLTASCFKSIGANVTVCARKESDLSYAQTNGMNRSFINEFHNIAEKFDIIINTVPAVVIDKKIINNLNKNCFIIDIASYPFGTDFAAASDRGIRAVQCPSLPGKVAPVTAGRIIAQGIMNIIKEANLYG